MVDMRVPILVAAAAAAVLGMMLAEARVLGSQLETADCRDFLTRRQ
jgi:hypothetical protein